MYYAPLADKKKSWLMFLACCAVAVVLLFVYTRLLGVINNGVAELFSSHVDENTIMRGVEMMK